MNNKAKNSLVKLKTRGNREPKMLKYHYIQLLGKRGKNYLYSFGEAK